MLSPLTHPANRAILLENDWGGSVYFILDGWVKIRTHNMEGKEVTLNIVGKGEIVGEMAALEESPRSTDAITLTTATISSIPAQDFVNLLKSEPLAGIRLSQLMAKRLRQLNRRLRLREANSLSRVADTLLFLAEGQGQKSGQGTIIPNLPHRELSGISGLLGNRNPLLDQIAEKRPDSTTAGISLYSRSCRFRKSDHLNSVISYRT
jgi:CRP-like cAMP-binding protein